MSAQCAIPQRRPAAPRVALPANLAGRPLRDFVWRAQTDLLSGLFTDLDVRPSGELPLVGDPSCQSMLAGWLRRTKVAVRHVPAPEGAAPETALWRVPESDALLLVDLPAQVPNRALALRKLLTRLNPGGMAFIVLTQPPPLSVLERELAGRYHRDSGGLLADGQGRPLEAAGYVFGRLKEELALAGFSVAKAGAWQGRYYGRALARHRSDRWPAGINLFDLKADGEMTLEASAFIPEGRVLEKISVYLLAAFKPGPAPRVRPGFISPSIFGRNGRIVTGDRVADYLLAPAARARMPGSLVEALERCLAWSIDRLATQKPYSRVAGRSLYIDLPPDAPLRIDGQEIRSVKIKGCTFNSEGGFQIFECRPESMLAFDRGGVLREVNFDDKPVGCMTFSQALNEHTIMRRTFESGIATDYPLGLCRYPGHLFQNRPTGSVLIGVADPQETDHNRFFMQFNRLLGITDFQNARYLIRVDRQRLPEALRVLTGYGRQLRRFHGAGLLHILGHNNQVSLRGKTVVFHDFEYSRLQQGMSRLQKAAYRLQDLRRAVFGLAIYQSRERVGVDFCQVFLSGYFGTAARAVFRRVTQESLNDTILKFYNPRLVAEDPLIQWMLEHL